MNKGAYQDQHELEQEECKYGYDESMLELDDKFSNYSK
jgi:hypothetical protein